MPDNSKSNRKEKREYVKRPDPLFMLEEEIGTKLSGKMHDLAEKPVRPFKKIRAKGRESYRGFHRKK